MPILNLGILAHVDAGKTTLTERLLYAAGVIDEIGSVDDGTTQTDSLALERQRGITIKSAVVSFAIGDVTVNLIDTPGHPDFIAEVERALAVLDGAVLVISAVEGVQPQTRVLVRALRRLRTPTLFFVNKIDRRGAREGGVLDEIRDKLTPAVAAMGTTNDLGTPGAGFHPFGAADTRFTDKLAELLAEQDDELLPAYVESTAAPYGRLRQALAAQTGQALVHPVFFGSAITGAGVDALMAGIAELLPAAAGDANGPVSGTVFKVDRGAAGEKIAFVRLFSGTVRTRDRLPFGPEGERKVTAIRTFDGGADVPGEAITAGQIGKLWGLGDLRIGDAIGQPRAGLNLRHFARPTLEAVIVPRRNADRHALRAALAQLAEQDPLIDLRQDDARQELFISLYGEVQKEVIQETLAREHHIEVDFRASTTICVERLTGIGAAVEIMHESPNPFLATVGLRIEPAAPGSGVAYRLEVELGALPLAFHRAVEDTTRKTLQQGLHGWQVIDCTVTMTHSGYAPRQSHAHQGFSKGMSSTGFDFRGLTPLVVMSALAQAGTAVCEPIHRFQLEIPVGAQGPILPALSRLRAIPLGLSVRGATCVLEGSIPAAQVHALRQQLPELTRGEGILESVLDRYERVRGPAPTRPRTDHNPIDRKEYLQHVLRRN